MKRIISLFLVLLMLFGAMATLASCASKDNGAYIEVYLGEMLYDFDPSEYYVNSNQEQFMSLLYEPLFYVNSKGKVKKSAAKDYEIDEENRTITIELRETYWSDNKRVCAADYVYAWRRILDPNTANPAAALFYDIENAVSVKMGVGGYSVYDLGISAPKTYTLEIKYVENADVDRLLKNLSSVCAAPLRQDVVTQASAYWSKMVNMMVFNGPFAISEYDLDSGRITLQRNVGYHQKLDEKNYTDEVTPGNIAATFTLYGEEVAVTYADIENKVKFYMGDASLADRKDNKKKATTVADTSTYSYVFNTTNPLFASAEVRRALSLAIDREAIVSAITFGKAANGFIPDAFGGSDDDLISAKANLDAANELLRSVVFTPEMNKAFTLTVENTERTKAIAELVKAAWESLDVGFTVTIEYIGAVESTATDAIVTDSAMQVLVKEAVHGIRNFDVIGIDWQFYSDDAAFNGLASLTSSLGGYGVDYATGKDRYNISAWNDTAYNYIVNKAYNADDEDDREDALEDAEEYLVNAMPVIPLVFNETFAFVSSELKNVEFSPFGNVIFTEAKLKNYEKYLPKEENED